MSGVQRILVVTGMHMLERCGTTGLEVHHIRKLGVHGFLSKPPGDAQDTVLAKTVPGFSDDVTETTAGFRRHDWGRRQPFANGFRVGCAADRFSAVLAADTKYGLRACRRMHAGMGPDEVSKPCNVLALGVAPHQYEVMRIDSPVGDSGHG